MSVDVLLLPVYISFTQTAYFMKLAIYCVKRKLCLVLLHTNLCFLKECLFDNTEWALLARQLNGAQLRLLECYDTTPQPDRAGEQSKHLHTVQDLHDLCCSLRSDPFHMNLLP